MSDRAAAYGGHQPPPHCEHNDREPTCQCQLRVDFRTCAVRRLAAMPSGPALSVQGLAKRYGSVDALHGVDLEVQEGELVGLLGPNGAGKSTLVKIACGLVHPTAGTAAIHGEPPSSPRARRSLGYLAELFRFPGWY